VSVIQENKNISIAPSYFNFLSEGIVKIAELLGAEDILYNQWLSTLDILLLVAIQIYCPKEMHRKILAFMVVLK
jgi:hypothetical protein